MALRSRYLVGKSLSSSCGVFFLLCVSANAGTEQGLLESLAARREQNIASIHSATGKAIVTFRRTVRTNDEELLKRIGKGGVERREVRWYLSGEKRRVDEKSIDIPEGEERFGLPLVRETAWSPEVRIYYHHFQTFPAEAYINKPLSEGFKYIRGVTGYFDPMLFFHIGEYASLAKVREAFGPSLQVAAEKTEKGTCYRISGQEPMRKGHQLRIELELDPSQGCNVTKMRVYSSRYAKGPVMVLDATYTDAGTRGRSYFPVTYHYGMGGDELRETVDAEFSEVVLNQPVDPAVFTFAGMGVAPGTKVIDMRSPEHTHSIYKGLPAEEPIQPTPPDKK